MVSKLFRTHAACSETRVDIHILHKPGSHLRAVGPEIERVAAQDSIRSIEDGMLGVLLKPPTSQEVEGKSSSKLEKAEGKL